jgi:hypothetical protein
LIHVPLLLAFGFGNLAMLGWLAAAAAPLLIHLWSRHRFREVQWAAVHFLLAAMRKNARRMQLQQWLLLAVRTLLIILIVLAVAEPYGAGFVAGGNSSAHAHKVLVIDGSYSMAFQEGDSTHFSRAKQLAAELVRSSSPADAFTVISMADPARTILGREVVDHAAVANQIQGLPQSHTGADLAATRPLVAESLDANANDPRGLDRQEVYFFTDLQKASWQENPDSRAERGNELWAALAEQAALVVVDVGTPRATNLAVTQLVADEPFVMVGREVPLAATLRQFGDQPRDDCTVELLVDDQPVGEQTIDVSAGGEATVRFTHRFNSPGAHSITLRAAGDQLAIDNSRFLVAPVRDHVRVLCVAGREGAASYIARALRPDSGADSAFEPVIASEGDLEELELSRFDCIFLCNVAQLTAGEAERLTHYAEQGGGVVFFLGDRVIPDQFNQLAEGGWGQATASPQAANELGARPSLDPSHPSLFPARITNLAATATFGIDPLDYRHPIVAPFRGRERAGLLTTPISRYFKLDLSQSGTGVETAAAVPGGDPLIVAAPLGRGRTIIVATDGSLTSVDPTTGEPWTTWPTWPSFLPIVRELLACATSGQNNQWQQPVGAPLSGTLAAPSSDANGTSLQIIRPDGRTDSLSLRSTSDGWQWTYDKTDVSGIYTLRGAPADASTQFAVNIDTAEGDLAKADAESLPPELLVRERWQTSDRTAVAGLALRSSWNLSLLWAAFALLFVESFLAWLFGRGVA